MSKIIQTNTIFLGFIFIFNISNVEGLTFTSTLSNQAEIDISVSQIEPEDTSFENPVNLNPADTIALYSYLLSGQQIRYWEKIFSQFAINLLILPTGRFFLPQIKPNPFSIILEETDILEIAQNSISQVYVLITQRTYEYEPYTKTITFFADAVLFAGFVSLNTTITIIASGIIAPSKYFLVPPQLQNIYPIASGSAS